MGLLPKKIKTEKQVIGWRETIGLPDLGIPRINAKIDTGARSSALHASDVELLERVGYTLVRFKVHPLQRDYAKAVAVEAPLQELRWVKNSGGKEELRPVICTTLEFMHRKWPVEITLTRRDLMGFRMLVGRQGMGKRFLVDPARSFVGRLKKKKKKKIKEQGSAGGQP